MSLELKERLKNVIVRGGRRGFTLIEIAIVLVIIGILIMLGVSLLGPLIKRAKYTETKEIVNAAVESVIGHGGANNKLPIWGDGRPDTTTDEFVEIVRNPNDAWTKPLYYIYDNNLTAVTIGGICGRKTTNLTVRICPDATCSTPTNIISNVAFITLSGSENYNNQTAGNQGVTSAVTINVYQVDVPDIDNYAQDMNRPEPYDDIVKWVTLDELRIKAGCVGAQLRIVNNELPFGFQNSPYSATVYAEGGVPFSMGGYYRWCRQGTAPAGLTFTPNTFSTDCLGLPENSWGQANNLTISGTPTTSGNFNLTFFVRDNNDSAGSNDNIAQKAFVLTISPQIVGVGNVEVSNRTRDTVYYRIDGSACQTVDRNRKIVIRSEQAVDFFTTLVRCNNREISCSHTYSTLIAYDSDGNGKVELTSISDTSCTIYDD